MKRVDEGQRRDVDLLAVLHVILKLKLMLRNSSTFEPPSFLVIHIIKTIIGFKYWFTGFESEVIRFRLKVLTFVKKKKTFGFIL